jgi:hypothetical protein
VDCCKFTELKLGAPGFHRIIAVA